MGREWETNITKTKVQTPPRSETYRAKPGGDHVISLSPSQNTLLGFLFVSFSVYRQVGIHRPTKRPAPPRVLAVPLSVISVAAKPVRALGWCFSKLFAGGRRHSAQVTKLSRKKIPGRMTNICISHQSRHIYIQPDRAVGSPAFIEGMS